MCESLVRYKTKRTGIHKVSNPENVNIQVKERDNKNVNISSQSTFLFDNVDSKRRLEMFR